jgi:pimeloyl-ACP methyl ester carboxylesterase
MTGIDQPVRELPAAVSGERRDLHGRAGRLSYYVQAPLSAGADATPLLLVHSVNAAASAYEVKPLYEFYKDRRTVYALELPGFGCSERTDRKYTPRLMTDAIHVMVAEIRRRHPDATIDALALSLSSEFLARAALETGDAFRSLALVSPTGFDHAAADPGPPGSTRGNPLIYRLVAVPLWRRPLFNLLVSGPSIRFFLRKTWGSPHIDQGLAHYDELTAHQEGAWHAPYWFVAGFLFSRDISRVYQSLPMPVFMAYGVRGDFTDYRLKSEVEAKSNWTVREFQTGALPHFEVLDAFTRHYDDFLQAGRSRAAQPW